MKNEMRLQSIGLVEGTEAGKIQVGDILRWNFGSLSRVTAIEFTKTGKTIIVTTEYFDEIKGEMIQGERKMRISTLVNIIASGETKLTGRYSFEMIEEAPEVEEVEEAQAVEKISFTELENNTDWKEAVIVFAQESFEVKFSELERSYTVEATEKYFNADMNGNSLYGSCLDGKDDDVRLDNYMSMGSWIVDYCYITEYKEQNVIKAQIEEATDLKKSIHEVSYRVTDHGTYVEIMLFVTDIANDVTLVAQQEGEFKNMEEAETLIAYLKKTGNKIEFVETMAYTG